MMGMKDPIFMPEGSPKGWPADEATPTVNVTAAGVYGFNLWVTDDTGSVSEPDLIKFTVGNAVDPALAGCMATVLPSVPADCSACLCGIDDTCRNAVNQTACGEPCWGLIRCLGEKCPNFRMMAMQMPPDYPCLTTNCMEFVGGATAATPVGMCINSCPDECRGMPAMMP